MLIDLVEGGETVPAIQIWGIASVDELPHYPDPESNDRETSAIEYVPSGHEFGLVKLLKEAIFYLIQDDGFWF